MSHAAPIVFVIDDNASVRESLKLLISDVGGRPKTLSSAQEFLPRSSVVVAICLAPDVARSTSRCDVIKEYGPCNA
jgi:FixJ family two-component response regulator